jgi:hypothetical protein
MDLIGPNRDQEKKPDLDSVGSAIFLKARKLRVYILI